ncbi:LysR family transcriptional regulator [Hydrogenovibrio sp. JE_KL2]|uniref:LysR family transcriptional regulator n=1 Tax=Hydrogenovibrio sp. JE_KL2 TaxID=2651188 RepID=UPI00128D8CA2|nr:LysR family transcriptional regulator [Hydrogenovibrio sp. JE_KL2]MBN2607088.1 LysR family transcriptional regulator [Thiotrichales bacterium]MPQ76336.1 LysR family transcriptional regulator [Hydrogenovibrio sp. JE_KL2]
MLEIKHLKTILSLAETHSVNISAQQLHMTQSALSHQIKLLESQLGQNLFERKSNPIRFTPAGETLLACAKEVLPKIQHTEQVLTAMEQGNLGRLLIGVDCHTCFDWLLPLVQNYQEKWQGVDLDILNVFGNSPEQSGELTLAKLDKQELDLVITSDPEPSEDRVFTPLFSYEQVCVFSPQHAFTQKGTLLPEDFKDQTLIVYPVDKQKLDIFRRFLNPANIKPKEIRHSQLTVMMLQNVALNRGVCILPKWLIKTLPEFSHLPTKPLGKEGLWSTLYAATRRSEQRLPYLEDFIHLIADNMNP